MQPPHPLDRRRNSVSYVIITHTCACFCVLVFCFTFTWCNVVLPSDTASDFLEAVARHEVNLALQFTDDDSLTLEVTDDDQLFFVIHPQSNSRVRWPPITLEYGTERIIASFIPQRRSINDYLYQRVKLGKKGVIGNGRLCAVGHTIRYIDY